MRDNAVHLVPYRIQQPAHCWPMRSLPPIAKIWPPIRRDWWNAGTAAVAAVIVIDLRTTNVVVVVEHYQQ